ncbi:glycerate kinase [Desulfonatronum thiosulfatophilum]|uniref:Glycerate kinase n=1 Tax=Desulfonatronum thiosulfatophilum TaxID=617002 RepID=A0A1G6CWL2_9BACT|nr:glycerate kinase [Desulfonatronum thiosulfatophilum]SDB37228.1 glycerate kinase [Desulfonatronum thiosulfatophilum]
MKIVVAPNAFKGCLSGTEAAEAISMGIRRVPKPFEIVKLPIADGGDGLLDVLCKRFPGTMVTMDVHDPLFRSVRSDFFWSAGQRIALIEMAKASGLAMVAEHERNPDGTTSYGTGELIRRALDLGAETIYLGIGGSATVDGAMGIANALGMQFLDDSQRELPPVGASLAHVRAIDRSRTDPRLEEVQIEIICDVDNPLLGPNGAALVYGPQKGAGVEQALALDAGLANLADIVERSTGRDIRNVSGSGAAGGVGGAMYGLFDAKIRPGIDVVLDLLDMETHLNQARLVITGEGQIDFQTAHGKAPAGIARLAKKHRIPCIALAGSVGEISDELYAAGITAVIPICSGPLTLNDAMCNGRSLLANSAEQIMRIYADFI